MGRPEAAAHLRMLGEVGLAYRRQGFKSFKGFKRRK